MKECGDGRLAAIRAGYAPSRAGDVAAKLLARAEIRDLIGGGSGSSEEDPADEPPVSVDWVVREARRTYDAAHEAGSLSTAVSCLTLIGKHLEMKTAEAGENASVTVVTGIEGAPGSDEDN